MRLLTVACCPTLEEPEPLIFHLTNILRQEIHQLAALELDLKLNKNIASR